MLSFLDYLHNTALAGERREQLGYKLCTVRVISSAGCLMKHDVE